MKAKAIRSQARDRDAAHAAAGREPARHAGDPARHPRVLLVKVDAVNTTLQGSGRLPRARRARARGDVERDGEPRHRHRVRAALRRAEAARVDAAVARRPAQPRRPLNVLALEVVQAIVIVAHRHRARLGRRPAGSSPPSCCSSSAPSRSPASACCSPERCGPRRTSRSPTGCSSCCCSSAGWPTRWSKLPDAVETVAKLLPAAALSETVRGGAHAGAVVPGRRARRAAGVGGRRAARRRPLVPLGGVKRTYRDSSRKGVGTPSDLRKRAQPTPPVPPQTSIAGNPRDTQCPRVRRR